MPDVTHRDTCRLCNGASLELVLPILPSAIGDAFVSENELHEEQHTYPLDTYLCLECGHLQNLDIVDPDILFRNYTYKTSASLGLVDHFRRYADSAIERLGLAPDALVVEMGSNDGSLLKAFKSKGMRVVGVDPARSIAAQATSEGIPTFPDFFGVRIAETIRAEHGPAALFCANNVFAHIDDMSSVVTGISRLLAPDGVFAFEVSYLPDMIDNMVYDTIYHEHVSHHSIIPLEAFFNRHDLTLFDIDRTRSKGGSIRGFAQLKSTGRRPQSPLFLEMVAEERRRGITQAPIFRDFFRAIEERKRALLEKIDGMIARGMSIAVYGASTTTTTLMYHLELGSRVSFIVDDNPIKHGTFSPGFHIPVFPSSDLYVRRPDAVVILAWIYRDPIIARHRKFIEDGGMFIVPLPDVAVVSAASMPPNVT
jgi:SAM-dependent methyltransferase